MSTKEKTMEAMTNMGMAASQARFLGLTARKSNTEYQAQQINQQRTALANESANLYNDMLTLEVPVPPKENDFYKIEYVLENSDTKSNSDYKIDNMVKLEGNEYDVTLSTDRSYDMARQENYYHNVSTADKKFYTITLNDGAGYGDCATFTYNMEDCDPCTETQTKEPVYEKDKLGNYVLDDNGNKIPVYEDDDKNVPKTETVTTKHLKQFESNKVYSLAGLDDKDKSLKEQISGYKTCLDELQKENPGADFMYFYLDSDDNKIKFFTEDQFDKLLIENPPKDDEVYFYDTYPKTKTEYVTVKAKLESSKETGRYSRITIGDKDKNPGVINATLIGKSFDLNPVSKLDKASYDQAQKDYTYKMNLYDKAVADINAKTEKIQKQDQQLELRIKQLDTEQNAIKTEMDSVQKVIEDNVDKTFNIFG